MAPPTKKNKYVSGHGIDKLVMLQRDFFKKKTWFNLKIKKNV